jgi:cation diffusion facilitator CzcD-associated flavoprotein CzcO
VQATPRHVDVVVIGAGAAGVAAAHKLHDAGVDIVVLEARERLGGSSRDTTPPRPYQSSSVRNSSMAARQNCVVSSETLPFLRLTLAVCDG